MLKTAFTARFARRRGESKAKFQVQLPLVPIALVGLSMGMVATAFFGPRQLGQTYFTILLGLSVVPLLGLRLAPFKSREAPDREVQVRADVQGIAFGSTRLTWSDVRGISARVGPVAPVPSIALDLRGEGWVLGMDTEDQVRQRVRELRSLKRRGSADASEVPAALSEIQGGKRPRQLE